MEELTKRIDGKLRMLQFTHEDTARLVNDQKTKALERQASTLENLIDGTHELKINIQQAKIEKGDNQKKCEDGVEISKVRLLFTKAQ